MGYKVKNDREKGKNRACGKVCWFSRKKITKQIVGENRCNDISFRPLSKVFSDKRSGVIKLSFFQNVDITSVLKKTQP